MAMSEKVVNQIEFSALLFDTLFGLIIFYSIDGFLDIQSGWHLLFYLFTLIVVVHWWLGFKADFDVFGNEISNSALTCST